MACTINSIINGNFEESHGYEYYMENNVMEHFNLLYEASDNIVKGSIARMMVKKKVNLAKSVNIRSEMTHCQTV